MSEHAQSLRGCDITAASSAVQWSPAFLSGPWGSAVGIRPGQHRQTEIGGHTQTDVNREQGELCQARVTLNFLLSLVSIFASYLRGEIVSGRK